MIREVHILLVEDSEGDILLTKEALKEAKAKVRLSVARDGEEAIELLQRAVLYQAADLPDMIFLDINLPKMNGIEVLGQIKNHDILKLIPVVMLTTSSFEKDIIESYRQYANSYITKPAGIENFRRVITNIDGFWFFTATLPRIN